MIRAMVAVFALAFTGCAVDGDSPDERAPAWGDPMFDCDRYACSEVTDCEAYDEGIVCACVYSDGLARSCEETNR